MRLPHIQQRALEAIDRLRGGSATEDDEIEFKLLLPEDAQKAARQIAGMANASRGEPFLWIIGVDEAARTISAVNEDVATWWGRVQARFESEPPPLTVTHAEGALVLAFEPDAPPYVVMVRHDEGVRGLPTHEVPWRDGARTRTAVHSDLVRLLVPRLRAPEIEVMNGEIRLSTASSPTGWALHGELSIYVTPLTRDPVTLPAHKAEVVVSGRDCGTSLDECRMTFAHMPASPVDGSNSYQLYCNGPGPAIIHFGATPDPARFRDEKLLVTSILLRPAPDGPPSQIRAELKRLETSSNQMIWRLSA